MKRGVRCIAQTINLSNPKTCLRPKQLRKTVGADVMESCPKPKASYIGPRAVPITICSRKDMERTCESKDCDCPAKRVPLTNGQKFCKALMFALKSAIMAGLIYWSYVEGVWGDASETEDLYYRIMSVIAPTLPNGEDRNNAYIPRLSGFKYRLVESYNHAVFNVMHVIANVPVRVRQKLQDVLFPADEDDEDVTDSSNS